MKLPKCPKCGMKIDAFETAIQGGYECDVCQHQIEPKWLAEETNRLNPKGIKEFVIDGLRVHSLSDFWDEIQSVLCPSFSGFGKSWAAFRDVLRGGFLKHELDENIQIRLIHSSNMRSHLTEGEYARILKTLSDAENVDLHVY